MPLHPLRRAGRLRRIPCRLAGLLCVGAILAAAPADAQVLDLDAKLSDLLAKLGSTSVATPLTDRVGVLDEVANDLVGPGGVLTDIEAEIGRQGDLLDLQAGDLVSLRSDLGDLRGLVTSGTNLTDIRSTVSILTTDLRTTNTTTAEHGRDISNLKTVTAVLGRDVGDLRGDVDRHERRLDDHEERLDGQAGDIAALGAQAERNAAQLDDHEDQMVAHGERLSDHDGLLAAHGRQVEEHDRQMAVYGQAIALEDARLSDHDRRLGEHDQTLQQHGAAISDLGGRLDIANQGVAMALAMKAPAVGEGKSFALSGGWGTFEGENAFAVSGAVRATDNVQFDGGVALGAGNASLSGRAGATISW